MIAPYAYKAADDLPKPLRTLLFRLGEEIAKRTTALQEERINVPLWKSQVEELLARYHMAALMTGQGSSELSQAAQKELLKGVRAQLQFLDKFAIEIQGADEWSAGWNARAAMYAQSIKQPYWQGSTKMLPLPSQPGDGSTNCLTNCGCAWRIVTVDEKAGDYDAFWERGKSDSCATCIEREKNWSPLQIRDGRLVA